MSDIGQHDLEGIRRLAQPIEQAARVWPTRYFRVGRFLFAGGSVVTVFQILNWAGVLISIALVIFLVKLYYRHIHRPLWERLREKYAEHSASAASMLMLLVVLFVAGTVLQRGLMEWSNQGLLGSGLIVWLAQCVALPLEMLHYFVELPMIWLRTIGDWLTTLTDLFQVVVWPAAAITIAWLLKGTCVQCFGPRQHGER